MVQQRDVSFTWLMGAYRVVREEYERIARSAQPHDPITPEFHQAVENVLPRVCDLDSPLSGSFRDERDKDDMRLFLLGFFMGQRLMEMGDRSVRVYLAVDRGKIQ